MGSKQNSATSGFIWSTIQKVGSMLISFSCNMILARLLSPTDFGCLGILLVFVNLSVVFIDAGFGSALIQNQKVSKLDYSTIFYWNIIVSLLLYLLLYLLSPLIANYYNIDSLSALLKVLGVILIFNAFSLVQITKLKKELDFKTISLCYITATLISFVVTIYLAYNEYGVWSLVVFQLLQSGINTLLLWCKTDWRPLLVFSFASLRKLFGFGFFILLSSLLSSLSKQIQALFIGKLCSASTLGYYTQAKNLEMAPTNVIYSVIGQVAFPLFSQKQQDNDSFIDTYKRIISCVAYLIVPLMLILIIIAKPLIILLLSNKWIQAIPYFQLLCIAGLVSSLTDINIFAISSKGRSRLIFKCSIVNNIMALIIISIGSLWEIYGIIIGVVINSIIVYIVYSYVVSKIISSSILSQMSLPALLVLIGAAINGFLYIIMPTPHLILSPLLFLLFYIGITYKFGVRKYLFQRIKLLLSKKRD